MSRSALVLRRTTTLLGIVVALAIGWLAIQVASAWTANAAPLEVAPISVTTLEAQLTAERSRSAQLAAELDRLTFDSDELRAALEAAQVRITQDSDHAAELADDLDAARKKLRTLEKAIKEARAALARQPATTVTTVRTVQTSSSTSTGEHEDDEDDEDHEEHDDD